MDKMTVEEWYKVIRRMKGDYKRASCGEKSQMLDTLQTATGLSRKYLSHLLNNPGPERRRRQKGQVQCASG